MLQKPDFCASVDTISELLDIRRKGDAARIKENTLRAVYKSQELQLQRRNVPLGKSHAGCMGRAGERKNQRQGISCLLYTSRCV